MSSQPEVAITIMTGGQRGAAASTEGGLADAGPTPMPLDQLPAVGATDSGGAGAPTPSDLGALVGAVSGSAAPPTPSDPGAPAASTGGLPTPLDLDTLAEGASGPAPARKSTARKSAAKKSAARRAGR